MWLGAIMSDYQVIALKHSGRYSIILLTFLAILFALDRNSIKQCGQIFLAIYVFLIALTFLDLHGKISIPGFISDYGLHIDLFHRGASPSSFFENRNPYAVASVAAFFWSLANLRHSLILSSAGIVAALYSIFMAGSRNGIITILICLLFFLVLNFKKIRNVPTAFILVLTAVIVVGIGYYSIYSQTAKRIGQSKLDQLWSIKTYKDLEKFDTRFIIFRAALKYGIANSPIIGSGTKTFGHEVFSNTKDIAYLNAPEYKNKYNSHNFLLTVWIEMGLVGLIAVLVFLWLWYRPALRGPPLLMMPMFAVCVGQILDYFVWQIFFMAFQSFFFAHFASSIYFQEVKIAVPSSEDTD
tara:strand:+ start:116 stop:1177 length:1062 start_codon:yes stop_codon:yes gene_type:complete